MSFRYKPQTNPYLHEGLVYSQQAKIPLTVIDEKEGFLRKGSPFPMLATERCIKEWKGKG